MFPVRFTLLLLAVLAIPYLLKLIYGNAGEPYPAIILPSGAAKVPVGANEMKVKYTAVAGKNNKGGWEKIDMAELLNPVPLVYQRALLQREFGLLNSKPVKARYFSQLPIIYNRISTAKDKKEIKRWLKKRLANQNLETDIIAITEREKTIQIPSGTETRDIILDEKFIYLD